jgi:hypothetical protein
MVATDPKRPCKAVRVITSPLQLTAHWYQCLKRGKSNCFSDGDEGEQVFEGTFTDCFVVAIQLSQLKTRLGQLAPQILLAEKVADGVGQGKHVRFYQFALAVRRVTIGAHRPCQQPVRFEDAGAFGEQARQIGVGEGKAEKQVSVNGIKVSIRVQGCLEGRRRRWA